MNIFKKNSIDFYLFIFHYIYNIEISHGCLGVLNCIWRVSIWILFSAVHLKSEYFWRFSFFLWILIWNMFCLVILHLKSSFGELWNIFCPIWILHLKSEYFCWIEIFFAWVSIFEYFLWWNIFHLKSEYLNIFFIKYLNRIFLNWFYLFIFYFFIFLIFTFSFIFIFNSFILLYY